MDIDEFLGDVAAWKAGRPRTDASAPRGAASRPEGGSATWAQIQADLETSYRRKVADWERLAPMRERGQRVHEAAMRRHAAGTGVKLPQRGQMGIAAAMPYSGAPEPPRIFC